MHQALGEQQHVTWSELRRVEHRVVNLVAEQLCSDLEALSGPTGVMGARQAAYAASVAALVVHRDRARELAVAEWAFALARPHVNASATCSSSVEVDLAAAGLLHAEGMVHAKEVPKHVLSDAQHRGVLHEIQE
jgi:hypothetical protein